MGRINVQEVRPAAQAGKFYPAEPAFLAKVVDGYLQAQPEPDFGPGTGQPKAVIAPHGGYIYSGAVAGAAYAPWKHRAEPVERVVLIGPSHTYNFPGVALPDTSIFATPLGDLAVDQDAAETLRRRANVHVFEAAHDPEFSIEVQLPFIIRLFGQVKIVPLIAGAAGAREINGILDSLWGGNETVIVVSSDLSRNQDYSGAVRMDQTTAELIRSFEFTRLTADQACGCRAIRGLLKAGLEREMRCEVVRLKNSGDSAAIAENAESVTGFGAFQFFEC